jgi:hypothetical protein
MNIIFEEKNWPYYTRNHASESLPLHSKNTLFIEGNTVLRNIEIETERLNPLSHDDDIDIR